MYFFKGNLNKPSVIEWTLQSKSMFQIQNQLCFIDLILLTIEEQTDDAIKGALT